MLQIRDLNVTMKKDLRPLLRDFRLALNPTDRVAIIGEEGDGKSTLLKLIYDPSLVEEYVEWSGEVQRQGLLLGYLSQEVGQEEAQLSGYQFCCQEEAFLESSPGELASAAAQLRFPKELFYTDRPVNSLSGGEKVKLRMALLTLRRPDVYLLDEPSNDLDVETLEWLEEFILRCGRPVVYISHDETLLENTANVILHIEQLRRKTLPRWTVARMGYRPIILERGRAMEAPASMWRSGWAKCRSRPSWPGRSGRRTGSGRRRSSGWSSRSSTVWTPSPMPSGTPWRAC